jgi:branched-chain amino acid transport system substrate-binding protein
MTSIEPLGPVRSIRRRALKLALGACAVAIAPNAVFAQGAPIKIGTVIAKQGVFAEIGNAAGAAAQMAIQEAGGKVLGRPVEMIWYDDASPQAAQQNASKLIDEDKVVGLIGGSNSASALAMAAVAKRSKIPFIAYTAGAREVTGKECNRYTFRTQAPVPAVSAALAPLLLQKGKTWYFVAANYAFGQDIYVSLKERLEAAGGKVAAYDAVPLGTVDFSSYLLKIRQAKPDVVVAAMAGSDLMNFLKQYGEYGLKGKIPVANPLISDTSMWAIGGDSAHGLYGKLWHYSDPDQSPEEKAFIAAWKTKFDKPPTIEAWMSWVSMRMMLKAIEQAKSTDPKAIVTALESVKLKSGDTDMYYRTWDHQLISPIVVVEGGPPPAGDKWDMFKVLHKWKGKDVEPLYGTKAEIGCAMDAL